MPSFQIDMIDIIVALIQGYLLAKMLGSFLKTKLRDRYGSRYYAVVFWMVLKLGVYVQGTESYNGIRSLLKLTIMSVFLFLFVLLLYQGEGVFRLYLVIAFMALSEISFLLAYMIIVLGSHIFDLYVWYLEGKVMTEHMFEVFNRVIEATGFTLIVAVYIAFLFILALSVRSFVGWFREKEYRVRKPEIMFLLAPAMGGLLICALLRVIIITVENGIPTSLFDRYPLFVLIVPAIQILSLASILYSVRLFQDMIALGREKSGRLIMEQQIRGMQEHIQAMNRTYAGIRSMKHDMRNQLAVIHELMRQMGQTQESRRELETYVEALERTADSLEPKFKTGNVVADAVVNLKYHEALETMPDIKIEVDGLTFPAALRIENYDIAVILCNGMDNAIEACRKLEEGEERRISLFSFQRGSFFFLKIENSFDGCLLHRKGLEFPTTDKGEGQLHGIGFLNMRASARKYYGDVDWKVEQGKFYLTVMMRNGAAREGNILQK